MASHADRPTALLSHGYRCAHPGQALIGLAGVIGVLALLALVGADVSATRRSVLAVERAVDQAAMAGVHAIEPEALARGEVRVHAAAADAAVRRALALRLRTVEGMLGAPPEQVAQQAEVRVARAGARCWEDAAPVSGAAVCVRVQYQVRSVLGGMRSYGATAQAVWTPRP